jgi:C_GCAxxG_C_C family probable redox protein
MDTINGLTRKEAMEKAFKLGFEGEANRESCSQASFNAVTQVLGIKNDLLFKCVSALEGGGADTAQNSCGAFSGPLVVFSYFFGRPYELWDKKLKDITSAKLGQKLYKKFVDTYGTAICKEMQTKIYGFETDFMDPDQFKRFEDAGGHTTGCPTVVGRAAAWAIDILWDALPKDVDLSEVPEMKDIDSFFPPKKAGEKKAAAQK